MCRVLEVSESGYYRYLKNLGKPDKDAILSAAIQKVLDESEFNDNYGVPRMQMALALRGIKVGLRRLKRVMTGMGLSTIESAGLKASRRLQLSSGRKRISSSRISQQISHIPNCLQIYLRSRAMTALCIFLRFLTASTEKSCLSS